MRRVRRTIPALAVGAAVLTACAVPESGIDIEAVEITRPEIVSDTIRVNGEKPPQDYDTYISAAVDDLQRFWAEAYPSIAGEEYPPIEGGVWPVWPGAQGVPGCGTPETSYADVEQNAFYCFDNDFIAYDDGDGGLFATLDQSFGRMVLGVVMAHEWGHAIQQRRAYQMAPVTYELQADCFAGAWVARVRSGAAAGLDMSDEDLRGALSGMMQFRDPPGDRPDDPGAHGSAFDRISAFQDGLVGGVEVCDGYEADPPTPLQLPFTSADDERNQGNMPYDELLVVDPSDDVPDPNDPQDFPNISLPESLDLFYESQVSRLGGTFVVLSPTLVIDASGDAADACDSAEEQQIENGVIPCQDPREVVLDEARTRQLWEDIGDFALGVLLGDAWAAEAQRALDLDPSADGAETQRDCLQGAYVASIFPDTGGPFSISPGDLDESVSTFLLLTDQSGDGSADRALARIASFRLGLLTTLENDPDTGVDRCFS